MSFDKSTRNLLARTVAACRRRLIEDVTDQLCGVFGLHPDGVVLPLENLAHLSPDQHAAARRLRHLLDHYTAGAAGKDSERRKAAYERMVLEISFTALNRLAALRLCEERGLVVECVRKGTTSAGFQMFERISGGALGGRYDTYRVFLECLFDELALDLGVLFDRMTPQSAVFPSERCMEDLLAELNKPELTHLWTEDETIGWVYQYFNPPEERKAMREASQSPRNSRELAVRNQFFTPRYVVEFLTDNTLGRIWYEMRKGETALKEECCYLVRRPNEVFLGPGEKAPAEKEDETDLSQEELLKRPVYIEHRPQKDPRDLRILDPACGSGHFLLYAFDLLERMYEEAWHDPESPKLEATGRTIQQDFETLDDLRREVPKLIIEHNLHGIDIDPRAVQIAALALWLRAQKSWKNLGLKAPERPCISRSNIVTAEPMPGEEEMRREFSTGLKPRVLGQIVDEVFEKMKLAGEAGSLLKIEEEIKDAVAAAKKQWGEQPKPVQLELFGGSVPVKPAQMELRFDVKEITDERFWDQAEDRILDALKDYAEQAENGLAVRRRLFAEDAARGFALIDLCRKRYDTVLMNPPFGELSVTSKVYIETNYPNSKGNILAHFMERADTLSSSNAKTGVIVSRTCFFLTSLEKFRTSILANRLHVETLVDLGSGVLDAMVETAAAIFKCSEKSNSHSVFFRLLTCNEKENELENCIEHTRSALFSKNVFLGNSTNFMKLSGSPYVYWIKPEIISSIAARSTLEPVGADIRVGLQTGEDNRFLRLWYEISPKSIIFTPPALKSMDDQKALIKLTTQGKTWAWYSKIDEASPFAASIHLLVKWKNDGFEIKSFMDNKGKVRSRPQNTEFYFRSGISYMLRSSRLVPYLVPSGVIPTAGRSQIYPHKGKEKWVLALTASNVASAVARFRGENFGQPKFQNSMVASIPYIEAPANIVDAIYKMLKSIILKHKDVYKEDEVCIEFTNVPISLAFTKINLLDRSSLIGSNLDLEIGQIYGFNRTDMEILERDLMDSVNSPAWVSDTQEADDNERIENEQQIRDDDHHSICSYILGCIFGRWDIRITIDPSLAPKPPDLFDPLPICPPGMLVGPDGLPAKTNRIVSEEWLRARPDANTLPPKGSVKNPNIPDSEYPLRISWEGVLVDDPGFNGDRPHRDDIVRRVREVFDLLWKDKSHEIEQEACDILGVSDLRDYFRRPAGFFQNHLKRYSKSRRKAPIYWPLSTASGSYTIWLYYHRLNDQTLYGAVNKYVEPKISEVERGTTQIENNLKASSGREATRLNDRLNEARTFLGELHDLREELLRIAALPYKPDLNDGVIINAAPFHSLFRLRSWSKDTEACWKKLEKGDYDWAHLAYTIWPDRVREVCKKDRSIAIAHGLEDLCEVEAPKPRIKGGRARRKKGNS
ncbi:MAG: BREX-1 system adenine-specific DNA-methyltransferase PglX [Candidatus Cloacimonetes bacterium]|nr:BREX-1 system adenine-specific DNA-methyltransferase PglX [Candidatus Cloacimonadota bacterium]MDY0367435.1 BREX-1 system adenine-specific DNA-methyltransferase PglX [Candidatus Syntrophosphaera sp.]